MSILIEKIFTPAIAWRPVETLKSDPRNARTHSRKQIAKLAAAIRAFGFTVPILVDDSGRILAGHARLEAAKTLGMTCVPVILIDHLNETQKRAYVIADSRLAELAGWDRGLLVEELEFLAEDDLDFDVELTGFETGEIDILLEGRDAAPDKADRVPEPQTNRPAVSRLGDLWRLGDKHRLLCGDARDQAAYETLLGGEQAQMVFVDPPYNVAIAGHVSGLGKTRHGDFAMACGEMSEDEFIKFLERTLGHLAAYSVDGAVHFISMDWRHAYGLLAAG